MKTDSSLEVGTASRNSHTLDLWFKLIDKGLEKPTMPGKFEKTTDNKEDGWIKEIICPWKSYKLWLEADQDIKHSST